MSNVFKLKTIALAQETTFGTAPASGYAQVYLATDVTFFPKVETFEFKPLRGKFGESDSYEKHTRSSSTLSFSVPLHSFLTDGDSYTAPSTHQLSTLMYHCLGGYDLVSDTPSTPNGNSAINAATNEFTTLHPGLDDVPAIVACTPRTGDDHMFQARHMYSGVLNGSDYYGLIDGYWTKRDGTATSTQTAGGDLYYSSTAYETGETMFPFTYTFEIAGDDTNDAWILEGCAGTCKISGEVNGLVWANFTFQVSDFTKTTRTSLNHTTGDAMGQPDLSNSSGDPIPFINSNVTSCKTSCTG